jgi:hypothetical protein
VSLSITCDICAVTVTNSYVDLFPRERSLIAEHRRLSVFLPGESEAKVIDICGECYDKVKLGMRAVIKQIKEAEAG